MPLNKKFQSQQEAIASYSWTDLSSGKGYRTFYGGYALPAGYFLSTTALNSGNQTAATHEGITTISSALTGAWAKKININFDTTFDTPQTINGDCFINCTIGLAGTTGTDAYGDFYPLVSILKNGVHLASGAATAQTMSLNAGTSNPNSGEQALKINIPETFFAIGDVLRFTAEVWGYNGGANTGLVGLAHDGSNRNDGIINAATGKTIEDADSTQLTFHVPFKIDVS